MLANIPEFTRIPGVKKGYRVGGTYTSELSALFTFHNETLNIVTLLITWMVSIGLWCTVTGNFIMILGPLHTTAHMSFSCGNHAFKGISPIINSTWRTLDVAATALASVVISIWLHEASVFLYVQCVLVVGQLAYLLHYHKAIKRGDNVTWNKGTIVVISALIVACYLIPMLIVGHYESTVALVIGGIVYGFGLPEKYVSGFDYFTGNTIMHMCLTVAHIYEFKFAIR